MDSLLQWLLHVSPATLYSVICATAAVENLFPPFPSDVVVAFGSFVAAQGPGTAAGVFLSTWLGNVTGAMIVYGLGRRYGAERLEKRLAGERAESRDAKLRSMFYRYGMPAVFVSRFVPGVRAVVPAFAGALKLNPWWTGTMIAAASGLWYGIITWIAFRVGADWPHLKEMISRYSSTAAIVGSILFVAGVVAWLVVRRRQKIA
ncbi:MAG TPA: DedA family protein [Gemmatimonadaceae bacterium]|nr:DedA family protein [Gemmatimonadaceae bacterium]